MKKQAYLGADIKRKLREERGKGRKVLIWKLSQEQKATIENMGYPVQEYLFSIKTRPMKNIRMVKSSLLKDIHYAYKRGKEYLVKPLSSEEREFLREYGITSRVLKYMIHLIPK